MSIAMLGNGTKRMILFTWGIHCPSLLNNYITDRGTDSQLETLLAKYDSLSPLEQNAMLMRYTKGMKKDFDSNIGSLIYPEIKNVSKIKLFKDMLFAREIEEKRNDSH